MDPLQKGLVMQKLFHIDGLVQYCSISIANVLEILQSCTEPLNYTDIRVKKKHF